jgi:hypothetical protein
MSSSRAGDIGLASVYAGRMRDFPWLPLSAFASFFMLSVACNSRDEFVGMPCEVATDCYPDVEDLGDLRGEAECLDKVEGGYCTHLCEADDDCCAIEGECNSDYPQVCAPYENQPDKRCFLSCEDDLLGGLSGDDYCDRYAYPGFGCRSTGGGSENRKVCVP